MQIEIRLIEKRLQLTKFQIFQRTLLDFNGTAMTPDIFEKFIVPRVIEYFFTVFGMESNVVKDLSVTGHWVGI